jgi:predicted DNA-binding protein YlxM (UPF0122 family)
MTREELQAEMEILREENDNLRVSIEYQRKEKSEYARAILRMHNAARSAEAKRQTIEQEITRLRGMLQDIEKASEAAAEKAMRKFINEEVHMVLYGTGENKPLGIIGAVDAFKETK